MRPLEPDEPSASDAPAPEPPQAAQSDPAPPTGALQRLEINKPRVTASTQTVVLDYVGRLQDGTEFDRGTATSLEMSQLIVGLREGLVGMAAGESKRIVVPPLKGYGIRGLPGRIPGSATLTFDVTVRSFR
jgi:FKBP-type peptidyl-prolyl cis-trans isomerase